MSQRSLTVRIYCFCQIYMLGMAPSCAVGRGLMENRGVYEITSDYVSRLLSGRIDALGLSVENEANQKRDHVSFCVASEKWPGPNSTEITLLFGFPCSFIDVAQKLRKNHRKSHRHPATRSSGEWVCRQGTCLARFLVGLRLFVTEAIGSYRAGKMANQPPAFELL